MFIASRSVRAQVAKMHGGTLDFRLQCGMIDHSLLNLQAIALQRVQRGNHFLVVRRGESRNFRIETFKIETFNES